MLALAGCGSSRGTSAAHICGVDQVRAKGGVCIPATSVEVPGVQGSGVAPDGARPLPPTAFLPRSGGKLTHINGAGLHLIEGFEGYSRCAYWDPYGGVWTVGFGQTRGAYRGFCFSGRAAAEQNLKRSIEREYEPAVHAAVGNKAGQNAVSALDSFAYNLGAGIFTGSLRSALSRHDYRTAAAIMIQYVHAGGVVLAGLVRRRHEEVALLLTPDSRPRPAPSRRDLEARRRALRRVLVRYDCRARAATGQRLGPTCRRWFEEGALVNRELRHG